MATATEILTLTQWFSPAFPVGAFAYSHGLEWAIDSGTVKDATQVEAWITQVLLHGAGSNDALLIGRAFHAQDMRVLSQIDATCRALAASGERLKETDLQGAAFCAAVSRLSDFDISGLTYPIAIGRAARLAKLPLDLTVQMYLQAFLSALASVAMRIVPLGQSAGQALIRDLAPLCIKIAQTSCVAGLDDLSATTFLADIDAMKHETQYSRMFRT